MAVHYAPIAKTARMNSLCPLLDGGSLELLSDGKLMARIPLPMPSIVDDTLTVVPQSGAYALIKGRVDGARLCSPDGAPIVTGFSVGRTDSSADLTMDYIDLEPKQIISVASLAIKHA